jgi:hypothetical protein
MALVVKHAIYGALAGGEDFNADAFDVTASLQGLINGHSGVVAINNGSFGVCAGKWLWGGGDSQRSGFFFAGENQTIDSNHGEDQPCRFFGSSSPCTVRRPGESGNAQARRYRGAQSILNRSLGAAIVAMTRTPAIRLRGIKTFCGDVARGGRDFHFTSGRQTVDFARRWRLVVNDAYGLSDLPSLSGEQEQPMAPVVKRARGRVRGGGGGV